MCKVVATEHGHRYTARNLNSVSWVFIQMYGIVQVQGVSMVVYELIVVVYELSGGVG